MRFSNIVPKSAKMNAICSNIDYSSSKISLSFSSKLHNCSNKVTRLEDNNFPKSKKTAHISNAYIGGFRVIIF